MCEVDPTTLLEWLQTGCGEEREVQLMALEQLCMLLLMSDNIDRCFETCPPRTFLPALCRIFVDPEAPDNVLEVTARAITYYLDVSAECTRRIVGVEGSLKAICNRLTIADMKNRTSKDLAEQCVKVLEFICTREATSVFDAGGLQCVLTFVQQSGGVIHKDTLHSAMQVITRLCSKVEPTSSSLSECIASLSELLRHEDNTVSESALRCFASIADRFMRKGVDPAPLAEHGLVGHLLGCLDFYGQSSGGAAAGLGPQNSQAANQSGIDGKSSSCGLISIVISLLASLCRGSSVITNILLAADVCSSVEKVLQRKDERCCLDCLRLVDLLLVLIFDGRTALPKISSNALLVGSPRIPGLARGESERAHRHLIECIRSKDFEALVEAIESGNIEVNFTDDVGQTLLNWAAAFGTAEMCEYLCERGADVNKGQRSSSLHYAACFGRPTVTKILLKYGANPDLRDEDGKTPLDKARERNDEGHMEVAAILENPADFAKAFEFQQDGAVHIHAGDAGKSETDKSAEEAPLSWSRPELAESYLEKLLPIFCQTFQQSIVVSVRRSCLNLIRKMVHYADAPLLQKICSDNHFGEQLVAVIASVFDQDDDTDGHQNVLLTSKYSLEKDKQYFLEQFARFGVFGKVQALATAPDESEVAGAVEEPLKVEPVVVLQQKYEEPLPGTIQAAEDAKEILPGRPYHWQDWCICRGKDSLYVWNDMAAFELSNGSNGWFRYILNNRLSTMYSSGCPEGGSDCSENRGEFIEKLQRARQEVKADTPSK